MRQRPNKEKPAALTGHEHVTPIKSTKEIKWVEDALRRSNFFLDSVIENIPHMIFVKDARELRFVRFNKAGEELLGYSKKMMIGRNDYDFFPKPEADFFTKKDREVLASGRLFDIPSETIHTKKKGVRILHTKKIPLLDDHGRPLYLLGISEDITDRLRLEKQIAEVSDREQRRIGQDLHDGLGQLLTGVAFMSKVLAKKLETKQMSERREAEQISDLVNQSISMTRNLAKMLNPVELESGGLESSLKILVSNTRKIFKVACELHLPFPLRFSDSTTSTHLYRIVQEAVDNAIKHGRAKNIRISFAKKSKKLALTIKNDGRNLPRVLNRHKGMGLSNMLYRATMVGGELIIRAVKGGGTEVLCVFPSEKIL